MGVRRGADTRRGRESTCRHGSSIRTPSSVGGKVAASQESVGSGIALLGTELDMPLIRIGVDDQSRDGILQLVPSKRSLELEEAVSRTHTSSEVELAKTLADR